MSDLQDVCKCTCLTRDQETARLVDIMHSWLCIVAM